MDSVEVPDHWKLIDSGQLVTLKAGKRSAAVGAKRGRPRKFARPSKAVTVTLPTEVIAAMRAFDPDLGRAIVRLARRLTLREKGPRRLSFVGGRSKVIVVPPTRELTRRVGVRLVTLWDGRAIIAFENGTSTADLELRLQDALQDRHLQGNDRMLFDELAALLGQARRGFGIRIEAQAILLIEGGTHSASAD